MPSIGDIIGKNSVAEQILIWGVLNQLLSAALEPVTRAIEHEINQLDPNVPLSPEILADMVNRGHIDAGNGADEAKLSGVSADRFTRLVRNSGNPPGPDALAEALRRGIIPEDSGQPDAPSYIQGIKQSRLQVQWADTVKQLSLRTPGPVNAVNAEVRNFLDHETARRLYAVFGGDPEHYDLEFKLAGTGPSPNEAAVAANRGIISWERRSTDDTSFEQAVSESHYKNKWEGVYRALAEYRPPPRTITAMFREGSVTEEQATRMLLNYGVTQEMVPVYLHKTTKGKVQRAHEVTETEIIRLYTERGISREECVQLLLSVGYTQRDTDIIVQAADLEYYRKLTDETIRIIHNLYVHRHVDRNGVVGRLDAVGIASAYRDSLLVLWDMEVEGGVKQLTEKQVVSMAAANVLTRDRAIEKLHHIGYSNEDAALIIQFELDNQLTPAQSQQAALAAP